MSFRESVARAVLALKTARATGRRRAVALLVPILAVPLAAQSSPLTCTRASVGDTLALGWYVAPHAAATLESGMLLLGWPYLRFLQGTEHGVPPDTDGVGFVVRPQGPPFVVPQPVPGSLLENPRLRVLDARTVEALFAVYPTRPPLGERTDSLALWSGRFDGTTWSEVSPVATLPVSSVDSRQLVGDGVTWRDEFVAPFIAAEDSSSRGDVLLVRGSSGHWRTVRPLPGLFATSYVDVAVFRDTLRIVVAAASNGARGMPRTFGLWMSRESPGGWTVPRLIVEGSGMTIGEPRLLSTPAGLILSWLDQEGSGARLRWTDVSDGAAAAIHERRISSFTSKGWGTAASWLSSAVDDSTAVVLALTPTGAELLATVPTVFGAAPLMLPGRTGIHLITSAIAPALVAVPAWLTSIELRCPATPTGPRR